MGYKKHSLQLWLNSYRDSVRLIPIVSWLTPADVPDGYLLKPSIHYCWRRLGWRPDIVVGDLGYIHGETKREVRETWKVAVVTKMKTGMSIIAPFESTRCVTSTGPTAAVVGVQRAGRSALLRRTCPRPALRAVLGGQ